MTKRRRHRPGAGGPPAAGDDGAAVDGIRAETEPEWAEAIRRGRKDRAERLRSVFASFDEHDGAPGDGARGGAGREAGTET